MQLFAASLVEGTQHRYSAAGASGPDSCQVLDFLGYFVGYWPEGSEPWWQCLLPDGVQERVLLQLCGALVAFVEGVVELQLCVAIVVARQVLPGLRSGCPVRHSRSWRGLVVAVDWQQDCSVQ